MEDNQELEGCAYCKCKDPDLLLQCNKCGSCFCNCSTDGIGSHIVYHIKVSKHTSFGCHYSSLTRFTDYTCSTCDNSNILDLKYLLIGSVIDIRCEKCLPERIDQDDPEYVGVITPENIVSPDILDSLKSTFTLENIQKADKLLDKAIHEEKEVFSSAEEYVVYYRKSQFVEHEAELLRECWKQENVTVEFKRRRRNYFVKFEMSSEKINVGSRNLQIKFQRDGESYSALCRISDIQIDDMCKLAYFEGFCLIEGVCEGMTNEKIECDIENIPNEVKHHRILEGFKRFKEEESMNIDDELKKMVYFPEKKTTNASFPKSEFKMKYIRTEGNLCDSQLKAIKAALENKLTLVLGPPGTGKTFTLSKIVEQFVLQPGFKQTKNKILLVSESNGAVKNAVLMLKSLGIKAVRSTSFYRFFEEYKNRNTELEEVTTLPIIFKKIGIDDSNIGDVMHYEKMYYESKGKSSEKHKNNKFLALLKETIDQYDVICTTCNSAGDSMLSDYNFPVVIADEAGQITEPSLLIPITLGCKHLVLVGDHKQLPPFVMANRNKSNGYAISLFERLSHFYSPVLLNIQYRSHPDIAKKYSSLFYGGKVKSNPDKGTQSIKELDGLFLNKPPFSFINHKSPESAIGSSKCNDNEAKICLKILYTLKNLKIKNNQIGIISPYEAQKVCISSKLPKSMCDIEIGNIDSFQGREKDIIIFSCVRSNIEKDIGFMGSKNRLNVALSRARHALFIIGDAENFRTMTWLRLIQFFKVSNTIFDDWMNQYGQFFPSRVYLPKINTQPNELCGFEELAIDSILAEGKRTFSEIGNKTISQLKMYPIDSLKQFLSDCILKFNKTTDSKAFKNLYGLLRQLGIIPSLNMIAVIKYVRISLELELTSAIEYIFHFGTSSMERMNKEIIYDFLMFILFIKMIEPYNKVIKQFKIDHNELISYIMEQLAIDVDIEKIKNYIEFCENKELAITVLTKRNKVLGNMFRLHYDLEQENLVDEMKNKLINVINEKLNRLMKTWKLLLQTKRNQLINP